MTVSRIRRTTNARLGRWLALGAATTVLAAGFTAPSQAAPSRSARSAAPTAIAAASASPDPCAVTALSRTADAPALKSPENSEIQEPRVETAPAPASGFGTLAWTSPGGKADPADARMVRGSDLCPKVRALDAALPKQGVVKLLNDANRTMRAGTQCTGDPFGAGDDGSPLSPVDRYCFDDDDSISREWIPQAVTGVSDAQDDERWGSGTDTKRPILIGSYDDWNPGRDHEYPATDPNVNKKVAYSECVDGENVPDSCNEKGVRVSFLDPATNRCRHVLLVWPYVNNPGNISFDGVKSSDAKEQTGIHVGGMVWYGNYLYVADTRAGIRVFDMRYIMDLNPDNDASTNDKTPDGLTSNVQDKRQIGRQNNVWYSYGYRYVMPQVDTWGFQKDPTYPAGATYCASTGAPKMSYVSLDRSVEPDELVMGEYCKPDGTHPSTGRVWGLQLDSTTAQPKFDSATGLTKVSTWSNYLPMASGGAQGIARRSGNFYINQSHGHSNGTIHRAKVNASGVLATTGGGVQTAVGPEDLYVEHRETIGGEPIAWSVSEHRENYTYPSCAVSDPSPCGRVLYSHRLSSIDIQP